MGIFSDSSEDQARLARAQRLEAQRQAQAEFLHSPHGRARAARRAGATIFQIDLPLSETTGRTVAMVGAFATSSPATSAANLIERIEAEGWRLENVGYVYRLKGSTTRDKFLASGQEEAMHGEIVGIYLFRATEGPAPSAEAADPSVFMTQRGD